MPRRVIMVLASLVLSTPALAAGVYKWVDEEGNVQFGDRPRAPLDAEEVRIRAAPTPAPSQTPVPLPQHSRIGEVMEQERLRRKEARAERRAERAKRERNCALARDRVRRLSEAGYLYDLDDNGERRIFSNDERSAAERRAREDVKKWCG